MLNTFIKKNNIIKKVKIQLLYRKPSHKLMVSSLEMTYWVNDWSLKNTVPWVKLLHTLIEWIVDCSIILELKWNSSLIESMVDYWRQLD